jgi:hypothetical protein
MLTTDYTVAHIAQVLCVQRRHNCCPAASFANYVMTQHLFKVHLQTFLSTPRTKNMPNFSCDTLVANERYMYRKKWSLITGIMNYAVALYIAATTTTTTTAAATSN